MSVSSSHTNPRQHSMQGLPIPSICGTIAAACVRQRNRFGLLLAVFVSLWRRVFLGAGADLADRRAAKMHVAPIPRLGSRLERHGDVGPGYDELVADAPHG